LHEDRGGQLATALGLAGEYERVRIHQSQAAAPESRLSSGRLYRIACFELFENRCKVARRDGSVPEGFGNGRSRRGFRVVMDTPRQLCCTAWIVLILGNLDLGGRVVRRLAKHCRRRHWVIEVQVYRRREVAAVSGGMLRDYLLGQTDGLRKLTAVFVFGHRELKQRGLESGADRQRLPQQTIVRRHIAAAHHDHEGLSHVQFRRQRIEPASAIHHLDRLALAMLAEQKARELRVPTGVAGRKREPLAIPLLGPDGIVGEAGAIDPCLAECRVQFQRSIKRLARLHTQLWTLALDRKSTRLNSSHGYISYAVFCLKKKK